MKVTACNSAMWQLSCRNGKEFLVANVADNLNVVEANGNKFKIQNKELDAEKIGRVTIDEQITFSGTEIDFDGVIFA